MPASGRSGRPEDVLGIHSSLQSMVEPKMCHAPEALAMQGKQVGQHHFIAALKRLGTSVVSSDVLCSSLDKRTRQLFVYSGRPFFSS